VASIEGIEGIESAILLADVYRRMGQGL